MGRQRAKNLHSDLSKERERGREEESKNRDLSNRSLKTDRGTESRELHRDRGDYIRDRGEGRKRAKAEI